MHMLVVLSVVLGFILRVTGESGSIYTDDEDIVTEPIRCRDIKCVKPDRNKCQFGIILDVYQCCEVCAHGPGDHCGPFGKCGIGLICVQHYEEGISEEDYPSFCEFSQTSAPTPSNLSSPEQTITSRIVDNDEMITNLTVYVAATSPTPSIPPASTTGVVSLTLSPSYGNILGGETISVAGPCFSPTSRIECVFDGIRNSSIFVSQKEVLCIAPQLQRTGKVDFRLLINDTVKGRTQFTSISIEKAHRVNATTPTNTVYFTAGSTVELEWNPLSIFPGSSSSDWWVTICMYGLNLENENQSWKLLHIFSPSSQNDGQESIIIPNDLDRNIEILPIVFQVSVSVNPGDTVQSGTLYTELVMSGQKAGLWTAQYYYINPLVANRTGYYLCQSWYESESRSTATQLLVEATMPCPPQEAQARAPNSGLMEIDYTSFYGNSGYRTQWLRTFHQDAVTCFGTGDLRSSLSSSTQECCYDGSGRLLTGSPGGGSLIKEPLAKSRARHFQEDVRPYLLCCTGYVPSCQKYYEHRPSDDGTRYQPQVPAWVFGDPHLVTLDRFKYTFNGKGEFTFIQTQNNLFTMQGRMQQFNDMPATVITAIAAEERHSDRVMIANTRRGIDAYINGERADLSVVKQQDFKNVTVIRDTNSTISVEFSSGIRISTRAENGFLSTLGVVLPPSFRGSTTKGLLGVYNGNASDDLLPKNGITPLARTSLPERIYNLFGLTWILSNADDSLFTYLPYTSFNDLHDTDLRPVFTVDSNSTDVSMCGDDESCIFDLVTTNDLSIGAATLAAVNRIEEIVQMSYPVVCDPACQNGACIANNTCQCSTDYSGTQCDRIDNPGSCDLNPCASEESCAKVAGSHICTPNCSQDPTLSLCNLGSGPCAVNHCNNSGVCRSNDSIFPHKFECICPLGYTGRLCDLVEGSYTINFCLNGGSCSENGGDDFTCDCLSGFSGNLCEIEGEGLKNMTIIIIAVCVGVILLIIVVLVITIVIFHVYTKSDSKSSFDVENPPANLKERGEGE